MNRYAPFTGLFGGIRGLGDRLSDSDGWRVMVISAAISISERIVVVRNLDVPSIALDLVYQLMYFMAILMSVMMMVFRSVQRS